MSQPQPQFEIDSVVGFLRDAIRIIYAESDGVQINRAGANGLFVNSAGSNGVYVKDASQAGINIADCGDGVFVSDIGGDGIYVRNATGFGMNIRGDKNASTFSGHIGLIYNENTGSNADILALKVARPTNPGAGNNFITFYKGDDVPIGRIEGNGSGGVLYGSGGGDFAECLPQVDPTEVFLAGDVVGVFGGKISHNTIGASDLMVITDRPAVLGNQPEDDKNYEKVSFIGQVPVRVQGPVRAGDWIVASGQEDGTGMAISSSQITMEHQIVGRAWESSDDPGIKRINTVVGLDQSEAKDVIMRNMQEDMFTQEQKMLAQQEQLLLLREKMSTQEVMMKILREQLNAMKKLISTPQVSTLRLSNLDH